MSDFAKRIADLSPKKRALLLQQLSQQKGAAAQSRIAPQSRQSNLFPLSFAQERLWFLYQLAPDSPFYNIPTAFSLEGMIDPAVLERSLDEIVRRHEVLRTTF